MPSFNLRENTYPENITTRRQAGLWTVELYDNGFNPVRGASKAYHMPFAEARSCGKCVVRMMYGELNEL